MFRGIRMSDFRNEKLLLQTKEGLIPLKGCWSDELEAYVLFMNSEIEIENSISGLWHDSLIKLIDASN